MLTPWLLAHSIPPLETVPNPWYTANGNSNQLAFLGKLTQQYNDGVSKVYSEAKNRAGSSGQRVFGYDISGLWRDVLASPSKVTALNHLMLVRCLTQCCSSVRSIERKGCMLELGQRCYLLKPVSLATLVWDLLLTTRCRQCILPLLGHSTSYYNFHEIYCSTSLGLRQYSEILIKVQCHWRSSVDDSGRAQFRAV